jgi:radical SAM superfamily enzyme YgiQ (UPF0313 family)
MINRKLYIKLIAPKMSMRPMDTEFKRRMSPSLSLVTLASLTPSMHRVVIEDENIHHINYNDNPDIVGITVNVDTSERAKQIARKFRSKGSKVVFGGIHASAMPFDMAEHCDSICIGEAEEIWAIMLEDFAKNRLKRRYLNLHSTDLSNYPRPKWNFIDKSKYLYSNVVITSRGCPYKCDFCYNSCSYINNKYRNRPLNEVLKEIDSLQTRQVYFIDDNLIGNISYLKQLIAALKSRKIVWHAAVSANLYKHPELITQMAYSGCKSLFIGFESINQRALQNINKHQNSIANYEYLIKMLHDNAIMVNASLVLGLDDDTAEVFSDTLKWLIKNKIETMTAHILTPYPGTTLYKRMIQENRIIDSKSENYNTSNVVFRPKNMTSNELRDGYLWMYKEFYKHRNIWKRIPQKRENYIPYFLFNYGYRKYGWLFSFLTKNGFMRRIGSFASRLSYGIGS